MAINLPGGLTVMAIARSILFLLVLVILPLALSADEKLAKSFTPIWRDAPLTEGDTELERLNRAFVQLADNARPAILQIATERPLPFLPLGDSDKIRVGDLAVVFGYPFGRESSMNLGIISRPGRSYPDSASYEFIQTDAGAYAGGSGGPLLNSKGHIIGMITMASERGNMGFATPI